MKNEFIYSPSYFHGALEPFLKFEASVSIRCIKKSEYSTVL